MCVHMSDPDHKDYDYTGPQDHFGRRDYDPVGAFVNPPQYVRGMTVILQNMEQWHSTIVDPSLYPLFNGQEVIFDAGPFESGNWAVKLKPNSLPALLTKSNGDGLMFVLPQNIRRKD